MNNAISLQRKVGQLLVIGFDGKSVPKHISELIYQYQIGGIILFGRNIGTPQEVLSLTTELQREAKQAGYEYPLLICLDQENGVVRRLGEGTTVFPGSMAIGATNNPNHAYEVGLATGKELKALGINWNLAPVADVNNNPVNPVISVRSFGESPEKVATFTKEAMKGMQDAGVVTTLKHFPGHGDTAVDSHLDLPVIPHTINRLQAVELKPFTEAIKAGADTIMTAHIYFPSIEDNPGVPATLSQKVITGLLREQLGFQGVVTTDCMEMNAIANRIGTEKGAVAAIQAGVDLVMISHTQEKQQGAINEIIASIKEGTIAEGVIDQSIKRINTMKQKYLGWDEISLMETNPVVPNLVGSKQHQQLADQVYKESVTVVRNDDMIPLLLSKDNSVLVVQPDNGTTMQVEDKRYASLSLDKAIQEYHSLVDVYQVSKQMTEKEISKIINKAKNYHTVIVGTSSIQAGSTQITLIEKLIDNAIPVIVVAMRSPYDFNYLPKIPVYINTYEFSFPALQIAAGVIFGKVQVSGRSPVTLEM
ncbi:beta-N-acetylhexosaminidase [Radiobacillus sp. PE A8.2]|uniref:beta-N-acetylhexosaminidase n=1 Tax=Radiobacillus sp. PE A8.2 TaxID=3380349 RepID=UPI00388D393E